MQEITAPSLTSSLYKSRLQILNLQPAVSSLVVPGNGFNTEDSSTSIAQVIPWETSVKNCLSTESESESYVTTDGQSASLSWNKAPIWGLRPDIYYFLTISVLLLLSALSDEMTGLCFVHATGPRQGSASWVRVPLFSWPYFTLIFEISLFVASYASYGHGGGIRPRLLTGMCLSTDFVHCLYHLSTDHSKKKHVASAECVSVAAETYLPSRYSETSLVYPPISRLLHRNGSTCYNMEKKNILY
jgi:hypothetical protein